MRPSIEMKPIKMTPIEMTAIKTIMAERIILYWRDIPAQVVVRSGRRSAKRELPTVFIEAIDRCAMRTAATDTDAYLAEWRRGTPEPCGEDLDQEADSAVADLVAAYPAARLKALIEAKGYSA